MVCGPEPLAFPGGFCQKCRISGPTPDLWNLNLFFKAFRGRVCTLKYAEPRSSQSCPSTTFLIINRKLIKRSLRASTWENNFPYTKRAVGIKLIFKFPRNKIAFSKKVFLFHIMVCFPAADFGLAAERQQALELCQAPGNPCG